jgi:hypothetical protein
MKFELDEDGMTSQKQAATFCGVSQQYTNGLVRSGKIKAKPDGRIHPADLFNQIVISDARRKLSKHEFEGWLKHFRNERDMQRYAHTLEQILRAVPKKTLAKVIGPFNYDDLRVELVSEDDEE